MAQFLLRDEDSFHNNDEDTSNNNNNNNRESVNASSIMNVSSASSKSNNTNKKKKSNRHKKKEEEMTEEQKQEMAEKIKLTMAKIVSDTVDLRVKEWNKTHGVDGDEDLKLKPSKEFIFGLSELVYDTSITLAKDLEMFRKHHNKKTVMTEDFMLFCRRNEHMKQKMSDYLDTLGQK